MIAVMFMQSAYGIKEAIVKPLDGSAGNGHRHSMSRDFINSLCKSFPGAEHSDPWGEGHDAWKVGGKMFAIIGTQKNGVSVKTRDVETAQMLIDAGVGNKPPYLHKSWIRLPLDSDPEELTFRITSAYDIIRASLTKKAQAALEPRSD